MSQWLKGWRGHIKQLEEKLRPAKAEEAPSHADQWELRQIVHQ
jgi:hypothetical protein